MNELENIRKEIDSIDREMAALFARRMQCACRAAAYKKAQGLPVLDADRERAMTERNSARIEEPLRPFYEAFLRRCIELSRDYQEAINEKKDQTL